MAGVEFFFLRIRLPPGSTLFPFTTLFRSCLPPAKVRNFRFAGSKSRNCRSQDRKSTRLNSSHVSISYAVFCLKKKKLSVFQHRHTYRLCCARPVSSVCSRQVWHAVFAHAP